MKGWVLLLSVSFFFPQLLKAEGACGDESLVCSEEEHCCEHVVAMFSDSHVSAPPYIQGQCLPKDQKCSEFWCGNRQCKSGFFGFPSVCCVNTPEVGSTPEYSCAYSELNCPGNVQQLTIRESQPNRTLQRS